MKRGPSVGLFALVAQLVLLVQAFRTQEVIHAAILTSAAAICLTISSVALAVDRYARLRAGVTVDGAASEDS